MFAHPSAVGTKVGQGVRLYGFRGAMHERRRKREGEGEKGKKKNLTGKPCPRRLCQLSLRVVNLTADRSQRATYAGITGVPRSSIRLADRAIIFTPFLRRFLSLVASLYLPLSFSHSTIFISRSADRARVVNLEIARPICAQLFSLNIELS